MRAILSLSFYDISLLIDDAIVFTLLDFIFLDLFPQENRYTKGYFYPLNLSRFYKMVDGSCCSMNHSATAKLEKNILRPTELRFQFTVNSLNSFFKSMHFSK